MLGRNATPQHTWELYCIPTRPHPRKTRMSPYLRGITHTNWCFIVGNPTFSVRTQRFKGYTRIRIPTTNACFLFSPLRSPLRRRPSFLQHEIQAQEEAPTIISGEISGMRPVRVHYCTVTFTAMYVIQQPACVKAIKQNEVRHKISRCYTTVCTQLLLYSTAVCYCTVCTVPSLTSQSSSISVK